MISAKLMFDLQQLLDSEHVCQSWQGHMHLFHKCNISAVVQLKVGLDTVYITIIECIGECVYNRFITDFCKFMLTIFVYDYSYVSGYNCLQCNHAP